jgi:hypothetical protein
MQQLIVQIVILRRIWLSISHLMDRERVFPLCGFARAVGAACVSLDTSFQIVCCIADIRGIVPSIAGLAFNFAVSVVLKWNATAGTTVPHEKCRGWCLTAAPLTSGTADFTYSTKNALRPILEGCPNVHLSYQNSASLLSQLHLSFLTGSTQRAKLYLCAVYQNSGVGNYFLKSSEKLREGTFLAAVAPALVSCLLCSRSGLPKILSTY